MERRGQHVKVSKTMFMFRAQVRVEPIRGPHMRRPPPIQTRSTRRKTPCRPSHMGRKSGPPDRVLSLHQSLKHGAELGRHAKQGADLSRTAASESTPSSHRIQPDATTFSGRYRSVFSQTWRGSSCSAVYIKSQPGKQILKPSCGTSKFCPDCLQVHGS